MALQSGARSEERESEAAFRHGGWRNGPKGTADVGAGGSPHVVASVSVAQPDGESWLPDPSKAGAVADNYGRAP